MNIYKREKGTMTLETAIILPMFFFMFMCVFGFFGFIAARNQIHHALIQSTKSLSMDPYVVEKAETFGSTDFKFYEKLGDWFLDLWRGKYDQNYTSRTNWYEQTNHKSVVKKRFVAFLSGGGNDDDAQEKLESIGVVDGLKGVKFSYTVTEGDLKITIKYKLHFLIDIFDIGVIPMEDSVMVKMWGYDKDAKVVSNTQISDEESKPEATDTDDSNPEAADEQSETEYSKQEADANQSVNEYSKPDGDKVEYE